MAPAALQVEVVPESAGLHEAHPRLLLITPPNSYRTAAYLAAAKRRGIDVLIASEGRYSLVSELAGGLQVDLDERPVLPESEDESSGLSLEELLRLVAVDRGSITGGRLRVSEPGTPLDVDLGGIRITLDRSPAPERYRITLGVEDGTTRIPERGHVERHVAQPDGGKAQLFSQLNALQVPGHGRHRTL